jgi:hypothetical protein
LVAVRLTAAFFLAAFFFAIVTVLPRHLPIR